MMRQLRVGYRCCRAKRRDPHCMSSDISIHSLGGSSPCIHRLSLDAPVTLSPTPPTKNQNHPAQTNRKKCFWKESWQCLPCPPLKAHTRNRSKFCLRTFSAGRKEPGDLGVGSASVDETSSHENEIVVCLRKHRATAPGIQSCRGACEISWLFLWGCKEVHGSYGRATCKSSDVFVAAILFVC